MCTVHATHPRYIRIAARDVRGAAHPQSLASTRDPSPAPYPRQVAAQHLVDAPVFVPLPKAPASFPGVALVFGREKLLSSSEVEGTLKDWPTDEQASLGRADGSLEPLPSSYNIVICSRRFEPVISAARLPIPRMQVREFEIKMATCWSDDDEDLALPRMPWQTAAGSAWLCTHGCVSPPAHLTYVCARSFQSCSANTARSPSWCCRRPRVRWRAGAGLSLRRGPDLP